MSRYVYTLNLDSTYRVATIAGRALGTLARGKRRRLNEGCYLFFAVVRFCAAAGCAGVRARARRGGANCVNYHLLKRVDEMASTR